MASAKILSTVQKAIDIPPECVVAALTKNYVYRPCLDALFLKGLNAGIVVGSSIVQVPQITRIIINKSAAGLSESSYGISAAACLSFVLYNYLIDIPFKAWGETFFCCVQNLILLVLCWIYGNSSKGMLTLKVPLTIAAFTAFTLYALSDSYPKEWLPLLGLAPTPCMIFGKLPQIMRNLAQGHTGQLSIISAALVFLGNLARIFTVAKEVDDYISLGTHIVAASLNAIVLLQILYYWNVTKKSLRAKPKED